VPLRSLGDVDAMRDRLRRLLREPVLARTMGEAGRKRVENMFTWECVVDRCLHEYVS
jgi:glycosyltransferase involved in cell wall biosynthesis